MTRLALCPVCGEENSEFDSACERCGAPLPIPSSAGHEIAANGDSLLGRRISHFQIVRWLGRGGMGTVYLAKDLELGRDVALKFLSASAGYGGDEVRFRREAQAAASLDHPNIGTVHEIGEGDGRRFIAMAFYDGETLAARLRREPDRRLPIGEAAAIVGQLASALGAAHDAGVIHRDLKPDNVMILRDGRVKLLDFGLARLPEASALTEPGFAAGTAAYMAPEQLRGEEAGPAADLWALGVVLHEMLAGERPFGGERRGMVHAILHEDPPPLDALRDDLPPALDRIVRRCLEKVPVRRYGAAREILAELAEAGLWDGGSTGSRVVTVAVRPRRRRPWAWAGAALALGILGFAAYRLTRPPPLPVYVAVLPPEVAGPAEAGERAMIAGNLQGALLRSLAGLAGIAALDSSQVNTLGGSPLEVARAVAAGEVIEAQATCAEDLCQVRLSRLSGRDGRVLWMDALQLPPSRPALFAEAVAAALRKGYPDRRPRFERQDLEVAEPDYRRYLELRRAVAEGGDLDAALGELEALRRRSPGFIEACFLESAVARRRFSDSGERRYLDRGVDVARRARELAPDDPRPLTSLFDLDLEAGNLDEAQTILDRLAAIDPASTLLRRGQLAERRGQNEEALNLMTAAVRMHPSWRALYVLANMEYRLSRLDAARRHLEELLQRSPGNADGLRTLAQIELLRDPQRAVGLLQQLVGRRPEPASLTNLSLAFLLLRRYPEAEDGFRRALALQPDDPAAALNLADCLTLLGRQAEASALYRKILGLVAGAPSLANWPRLSIKAQALAHLGQSGAAIETIQQALRLTPDNAQLALEAAVVYVLVGERVSAVFQARRAADLGVEGRWFTFPWFDPLRSDPAFAALASRRP